MQIKNLVTLIAATLLIVGIAPTSSAQDNNSTVDRMEVITITAKRQATTVATACVNEVMAHTAASVGSERADGNFSGYALDSRRAGMINLRQAIKHCIEQAAPAEAQI